MILSLVFLFISILSPCLSLAGCIFHIALSLVSAFHCALVKFLYHCILFCIIVKLSVSFSLLHCPSQKIVCLNNFNATYDCCLLLYNLFFLSLFILSLSWFYIAFSDFYLPIVHSYSLIFSYTSVVICICSIKLYPSFSYVHTGRFTSLVYICLFISNTK